MIVFISSDVVHTVYTCCLGCLHDDGVMVFTVFVRFVRFPRSDRSRPWFTANGTSRGSLNSLIHFGYGASNSSIPIQRSRVHLSGEVVREAFEEVESL